MQSVREPGFGRAMVTRSLRASAANRTSVWFSDDAEKRRRDAAAAQEASARRGAVDVGRVLLDGPSYAEIRGRAHALRAAYLTALFRRVVAASIAVLKRAPAPAAGSRSASRAKVRWRPELFGCVALTGVALAMIGGPFMGAGARPCRTEPAGLTPGANLEVRMTVSHNAACAIWTKAEAVSFDELHVMVPPKHGSVAPRGRTGVTYRPAPQFTGEDSFAFTLHGRLDARDNSSLVRVRVTVQ